MVAAGRMTRLLAGSALVATALSGFAVSAQARQGDANALSVIAAPPGVTFQTARPPAAMGGGGGANAAAAAVAAAGGGRQTTLTVYSDDKGLTLYTYDKDTTPGVSSCVDACAETWHPFV